MIYTYPEQTVYGKIIAKSKLYESVKTSSAVKDMFIKQVKQIRWANELSQDVLNIDKTPQVPKIIILRIELHTADFSIDILRTIDKGIPFPVIFELEQNNQIKTIAIYKRPNESDGRKWVVQGEYLSTNWYDDDTPKTALLTASNLEKLYKRILGSLLPDTIEKTDDIVVSVEKLEQIKRLEKERDKLLSKKVREKQFNRKQDIQKEINKLSQKINKLKN